MLRRSLVGLAALVIAGPATARSQQQEAEAEVLAVVRAMLRVIETKDPSAVAAHVDSTTRFTLLRPAADGGGAQVVLLSGNDFLQRLAQPGGPAAKELIRNPEVRIDGDLATVWTEYQFLVDGAVSHCGYDAFHLARVARTWKVLNVSDSFRREGCGDPWPGGV